MKYIIAKFASSWFAEALVPKLSYEPIEEEEAIAILGEVATVEPEYRPQLRMLIDYLEEVGLIKRAIIYLIQ